MSASSRVTKESFVYENIDPEESATRFKLLVEAGFLDAIGIVLDKEITYGDLSFLFPLSPSSFEPVNPGQAELVYTRLREHEIILATQCGRSGNAQRKIYRRHAA